MISIKLNLSKVRHGLLNEACSDLTFLISIGALIYYIRRCLHDYGDKDAIEILQNLQEAMAADSRILIVEQVVSSTPTIMDGLADFVMATIGGKERSVSEFQFITEKAGLKIKEVHTKDEPDVSVIECVKA